MQKKDKWQDVWRGWNKIEKDYKEQRIGDICGPKNLHLCPEKKQKQWEDILAKPEDELLKIIEEKDQKVKKLRYKPEVQSQKIVKQYGKERLEKDLDLTKKLV